jgi:hypothetical protein
VILIPEISSALDKQEELLEGRENRLGQSHTLQRLEFERQYENRFQGRLNFFRPDIWYSLQSPFTQALKLTGLCGRGRRNANR